MATYDYDLLVIGAGSGGVRAARMAAGHGARTAIIEEDRIGGTCVIRGCVPKKLLVYASRFRDEFEDAVGFGWSPPASRFDWPTLIAAKDREIARLEGLYAKNLDRSGVEVIRGRAQLQDAHSVRIEDGKATASAKTILIATGASPFVPNIPGAAYAITSNEAFNLAELPASIVVVGGGYIAVEFACIFAGLGTAVTLLYRGDKILRGFDEDLRDGLTDALGTRGIDLKTKIDVSYISEENGFRLVNISGGVPIRSELVMFATGRVPNTQGLGLKEAGVATGPRGQVLVDMASRSNVPSIYAIGDVTDRVNLTPAAIREGQAFADSVFGGKPWSPDFSIIPTAVFSTPELATVGISEHVAPGRLHVYKGRFRPLKATLSGRDEHMMMKLVVNDDTGKVVGCHVLGPDAAEIVQMAAIAIRMGATKEDFDATLALHPSVAEELVTMREKWVAPAEAAG